jgi:lipopolysaccharide biosynthesis glycosyltransferase
VSVLQVACAVEGDYVPHCAAMLHSVLANGSDDGVRVHYLHGPELAPLDRDRLAEMVGSNGGEISFHAVHDERVKGLPVEGFTRKATWYRIFLPELLEADRVLYLDADLIVLETLAPLWETDLDQHYIAAVTNVLQLNDLRRPAAIGLSSPHRYFNAGVLLMNLELMRKHDMSRALLEYGVANAGNLWRDQDALNAVLGERRLPLHPRWNCMNSVLTFPWSAYVFDAEELSEARQRPAIRHFEGPDENKPWHFMSEPADRGLYRRHRLKTPWPRYRLEGLTARNVARRLRRSARARAARRRSRRRAAITA